MRRHIHTVIIGLLASSLVFDTARAARHGRCRIAARGSSSCVCAPAARACHEVVDPCVVSTPCHDPSHAVVAVEYRAIVEGECDPCASVAVCCDGPAMDHGVVTSTAPVDASNHVVGGDAAVPSVPSASSPTPASEAADAPAAPTSVVVPETDAMPPKTNAPQPTAEPNLQPVDPAEKPEPAEKPAPRTPDEAIPTRKPESDPTDEPTEEPVAPKPPAAPVPAEPAPLPAAPPVPPAPPPKPREENLFDDEAEETPADTAAAEASAAVPRAAEPAATPDAPAESDAEPADAPSPPTPPRTPPAEEPSAESDSEPVVPVESDAAAPEADPVAPEGTPAGTADVAERVAPSTDGLVLELPLPTKPRSARRQGPPLRRWVDASGAHATVGRFRGFQDDVVEILKSNGSVIRVPLDRLSEIDRDYVDTVSGRLAAPAVADTVGM